MSFIKMNPPFNNGVIYTIFLAILLNPPFLPERYSSTNISLNSSEYFLFLDITNPLSSDSL